MLGSKYSNNALLGAVITLLALYILLGSVLETTLVGIIIIAGILIELSSEKKSVNIILPVGTIIAWCLVIFLRPPQVYENSTFILLLTFGPLLTFISWALSNIREEPQVKWRRLTSLFKCFEKALEE